MSDVGTAALAALIPCVQSRTKRDRIASLQAGQLVALRLANTRREVVSGVVEHLFARAVRIRRSDGNLVSVPLDPSFITAISSSRR